MSTVRDPHAWCRRQRRQILDAIATTVNQDSPSFDREAAQRLASHLSEQLAAAGADGVERYPQQQVGDHLLARWSFPARREGRRDLFAADDRPALVLCHYDTVWESGEARRRPFRVEGERARGPGIYDMKAGLMQAVWALRCLGEAGGACRPVRVLVTSDEETGSGASRGLIERLAAESAYVLVVEPGVGRAGHLKTWRKGVGLFRLRVRGRAAHAGADHGEGVNAVEELARQILRLHAMTDYERGTTVTVGVVRGGTRSNVVPAEAEARVDCRVVGPEEGERMVAAVRGLQPVLEGARIEVEGGLNRPPMQRSPIAASMFEAARDAAAEMGVTLEETGTGGGSDGNFTAAMGVPTLDGLGAVGHGAHSVDEHILVDTVPFRTALLARLLQVL